MTHVLLGVGQYFQENARKVGNNTLHEAMTTVCRLVLVAPLVDSACSSNFWHSRRMMNELIEWNGVTATGALQPTRP